MRLALVPTIGTTGSPEEGLNGASTQFVVNINHQARSSKGRIYKHK